VPHLRLPAIDQGVRAFLWAAFFGLYVYLGLVAVGITQGVAVILAALSFGAIFLFVRIFGDQELRQPTSTRDDAA
jgi:hypothetical protein